MTKPLAFVTSTFPTPTLEQMGIEQVRLQCLNELRSIKKDVEKDVLKIFTHFSAPRPFVRSKIHLTRKSPSASIELIVKDPQANSDRGVDRVALLNAGTSDHMVTAKRKPLMRWKTGYRQKTKSKWIGSRRGGKFGNKWASSKRHMVKGIRARKYGETIAKRWDPIFHKRILKACRIGARKAHRQRGL